MRINKSFHKMLAAVFAAGIFAVMPLVSAEVREYEGFGEYVMSDFETPDVAKQRAKVRAEQNAMEQAGVYVESYTKVINHQVTHDEIVTMTNGILKVKDVQYGKMIPTNDGKGILIRVTIKADIDTDDITKWISQNKQNVNALIEHNKRLQRAKEEQDKKIQELQKQVANVKTIQDKNEIQERFTTADQEFLSNKKVEEAAKLLDKGDNLGALALGSQAVELNPKNDNAYSLLGITYAKMKDEQRSIENCTKAIELHPDDYLLYGLRGWAYSLLNNYSHAIIDFTKSIELAPEDAATYVARGGTYYRLGKYTQAIIDYTKAIYIGLDEKALCYCLRGRAYHKLEEYEKEIDDYSKAIEIDPKYADAYFWRGYAYQKIEEFEKAVDDYTKAIEIEPQKAHTYYARGVLYQKLEDYEKAFDDYTKTIEIDPKYAKAYARRAAILADKMRDYPHALADMTRAIELDSNKPGFYRGRAEIYRVMGNKENADADNARAKELEGKS